MIDTDGEGATVTKAGDAAAGAPRTVAGSTARRVGAAGVTLAGIFLALSLLESSQKTVRATDGATEEGGAGFRDGFGAGIGVAGGAEDIGEEPVLKSSQKTVRPADGATEEGGAGFGDGFGAGIGVAGGATDIGTTDIGAKPVLKAF